MEEIAFTPGSVPVVVVARVYGKDASWVRAGIISGWLPIGKATRNGKLITNIEEMNSRYGLIICIIVGIIIGIVFGRRVFRSDVVGSLRVDQSDPDSGPYLFLELSHEGVDAIYKKKYVVLKVNIQDYISHE